MVYLPSMASWQLGWFRAIMAQCSACKRNLNIGAKGKQSTDKKFKDHHISHDFISSYGIYLAQNLARLVIKRGFKPFVVIRHENEASKSLYKKLDFKKEFDMARIVFTPFEHDKEEAENDDANEKVHENGKANGNHVNGKTGYNGVNNNHKD